MKNIPSTVICQLVALQAPWHHCVCLKIVILKQGVCQIAWGAWWQEPWFIDTLIQWPGDWTRIGIINQGPSEAGMQEVPLPPPTKPCSRNPFPRLPWVVQQELQTAWAAEPNVCSPLCSILPNIKKRGKKVCWSQSLYEAAADLYVWNHQEYSALLWLYKRIWQLFWFRFQ